MHEGDDGDPLDVLVLSSEPVVPMAIVRARPIGLMRMADEGAQDDKLIAVQEGTALAKAKDLADLDALFPGVTSIVETWFENYKGPGAMESQGFAGPERALEVLEAAIEAF